MRKEDIEALLARLPAGARLSVVTVELPAITTERQAMAAAPFFAERTPEPEMARGRSTSERLETLRRQRGLDAALKLREWKEYVPLSEREMERAIRFRALAAQEKGAGRDHAALTISIREMEAYLATVDAVERGAIEPPGWWILVRPQAARRSPARRRAA